LVEKSSEDTDLALTDEDKTVLKVWALMDKDPTLKELPKPTYDYIEFFLEGHPELKSMTNIEKREHYMNLIVLGWIRNHLLVSFAKAQEEHGEKWIELVEAKYIRLASNVVKEQEPILQKLFHEASMGIGDEALAKKIVKSVTSERVTVELGEEPKPIKAEYKVVEDGKEEG
jgi:hypothetical protein